MSRLTIETAERIAQKMRSRLGVGTSEPISMKTVLRQLRIMTVYRPLSEKLFGLSLSTADGKNKFMLINSNSTRGRQHFTIAHELYHLYFDEAPTPHFCEQEDEKTASERSADIFASALLMPQTGIILHIPTDELKARKVSIETALRLGQLYGVSHSTLVLRLKELKIIRKQNAEMLQALSVKREALLRGFELTLYNKGNEGLVIGDFGVIARRLFDEEKISEGHYMELLNMITHGEGQDNLGC